MHIPCSKIKDMSKLMMANRKSYRHHLKNKYPLEYDYIRKTAKGKGQPFSQVLYHLENGKSPKKCPYCKVNTPTFDPRLYDYLRFCSSKCSNSDPSTKERKRLAVQAKYGVDNPSQAKSVKRKKRITTRKNYGVDVPAQSAKVQAKMRSTMLERHGVAHAQQSKKIRKATKKTCMKTYGVDTVFKSKKVQAKMRSTMLERHGAANPFSVESIKAKCRDTLFKNYGVKTALLSPVIQKRRETTCRANNGVKWPTQSKAVKDKSRATNLEKCGFEYATQSPEVKAKFRDTCMQRYGVAHPNQDRNVFNKSQKSRFKRKEVLRNGKKFILQGFEPTVLDYFISQGIPVNKIFYRKVPSFPYAEGRHVYHPDFLIIKNKEEWVVEVKSFYTVGLVHEPIFKTVMAKARAVMEDGYNFMLVIPRSAHDEDPIIIRNRRWLTHKNLGILIKRHI